MQPEMLETLPSTLFQLLSPACTCPARWTALLALQRPWPVRGCHVSLISLPSACDPSASWVCQTHVYDTYLLLLFGLSNIISIATAAAARRQRPWTAQTEVWHHVGLPFFELAVSGRRESNFTHPANFSQGDCFYQLFLALICSRQVALPFWQSCCQAKGRMANMTIRKSESAAAHALQN